MKIELCGHNGQSSTVQVAVKRGGSIRQCCFAARGTGWNNKDQGFPRHNQKTSETWTELDVPTGQ